MSRAARLRSSGYVQRAGRWMFGQSCAFTRDALNLAGSSCDRGCTHCLVVRGLQAHLVLGFPGGYTYRLVQASPETRLLCSSNRIFRGRQLRWPERVISRHDEERACWRRASPSAAPTSYRDIDTTTVRLLLTAAFPEATRWFGCSHARRDISFE